MTLQKVHIEHARSHVKRQIICEHRDEPIRGIDVSRHLMLRQVLVQVGQVYLYENLKLEAENPESALRQEVEDLAKLVLTKKRDQEPESIFLVLLQMDQSSACDEIHPLCVSERLRIRLLLEHGDCRQDPVQFELAWLLFLKELQVGKRAPDILPDLRHGRPLRHTRLKVLRYKVFIEVLRIRVSDSVQLAPIDPEVSPLDRGAQASILQ